METTDCSVTPTPLAATAASLAKGFGPPALDVFVTPDVWLPASPDPAPTGVS